MHKRHNSHKLVVTIFFSIALLQVGTDFGIDWDGPVPEMDENTVHVNEIPSPLTEQELHALCAELSQISTDNNEDSWWMQYIVARRRLYEA